MSYSSKPNRCYAAFRPVIAALIRALCAVPKEAREEWASELMGQGTGTDAVPPEELVIRQVLGNLNVAEDVANSRREKERPKPYPIVCPEPVRRRRAGPPREVSLSSRVDVDGPPGAA